MVRGTTFLDALDDEVAEGIRLVGSMLVDDVDAIAEELVAKIFANEPAYQAGKTITVEELKSTVVQTATGVFTAIAGGPLDALRFEQNGRRRASSSIPLHAVLHAYRIGGLHHWECFARMAARLPHGDRIIAEGSNTVWSIIDLASLHVTDGYREQVEELQRANAEERSALLVRLLDGKVAASVELWDAAETLSLPVAGTFVVVATPHRSPGTESIPGVEEMLARHNLRSVWMFDSSSQVGLLSLVSPKHLGRARELLDSVAVGPIGISEPFESLESAPTALRQARVAMAAGMGSLVGVTAYADVPLQAMLVLAPQSAEQLRQAVLGPLLDDPRRDGPMLLETLESWIRAGGSATDCAGRLYVHRNSVTRRLQRIHELTGWDPHTPQGIGMLYVALEAHRLTGTAIGTARPESRSV